MQSVLESDHYIRESDAGRVAMRLRWLRHHLGMNQREFSEALGFATNQYNNWERARQRLPLEPALRINEVFGTTLDFLYLNRADTLPAHLWKAYTSSDLDASSRSSSD